MIIIPCSGMFRNVPECSGIFHVPGFIEGHFKGFSTPKFVSSVAPLKYLFLST